MTFINIYMILKMPKIFLSLIFFIAYFIYYYQAFIVHIHHSGGIQKQLSIFNSHFLFHLVANLTSRCLALSFALPPPPAFLFSRSRSLSLLSLSPVRFCSLPSIYTSPSNVYEEMWIVLTCDLLFFFSNLLTLDWVFAKFICLYLIRREKKYFFWNKPNEFTFVCLQYSNKKGMGYDRVLRNCNVNSYPSCGKRRQQKHDENQIKIKRWNIFEIVFLSFIFISSLMKNVCSHLKFRYDKQC